MKLAELFGFSPKGEPAAREAERSGKKLISACQSLLSERGEVSSIRLATEILAAYQTLDAPGRDHFFSLLAQEFSPDPERVGQAADAYRKEPSGENLSRLQRAVEAPRQELFRRLNIAPHGTRVLVEMRAALLRATGHEASLAPIASDLGHLLASWFNRGFLVLRRIDWHSSATVLEKLIQYEAVHQIHGWNDLRRRLAADRRCYAFFHPALEDEPIIFVEAALTQGMSDRVQPLLDPESAVASPDNADTAVFYSITNCQEGLRGVPFGNFLIKQVVEDLGREFPRLRRFATLSPIPGFRAWLQENKTALDATDLVDQLSGDWWKDEKNHAELKARLVPLCARYLLREKRRNEPIDSVARFHLRNGARLERINWLSDTSAAGLDRAAGMTVNYVYRLGDLEHNHELYTRDYKIAASYEIEALSKQSLSKQPVARPSAAKTALPVTKSAAPKEDPPAAAVNGSASRLRKKAPVA